MKRCNFKYISKYFAVVSAILIGSSALVCFFHKVHIYAYNTSGHIILKSEKELGYPVKCFLLDELINEVSKQITIKQKYTINEAVKTLFLMDTIIKSKSFTYQKGTLLFSETLSEYRYDCDTISLIYVSIAEALELPISMVALPSHVFIRWVFSDGTHINWSTTYAKVISDREFIESFRLNNHVPHSFMRILSKDEIGSMFLCNRAIVWSRRKNNSRAVTYFDRSIELFPTNPTSYFNRGYHYYSQQQYSLAREDFMKALELYPGYSKASEYIEYIDGQIK